MGRAIVVRTDYTSGDVRRVAQRVKNAAQVRRLLAIAAVLDGRASWATLPPPPARSQARRRRPRVRGLGRGVLAIDQAAADACSKPPIASRVMSSVSSSVNGSSVVMLNGSWANSSRFRTKMLHWPISQMATLRATRFDVPGGRNRRTISTAVVR